MANINVSFAIDFERFNDERLYGLLREAEILIFNEYINIMAGKTPRRETVSEGQLPKRDWRVPNQFGKVKIEFK